MFRYTKYLHTQVLTREGATRVCWLSHITYRTFYYVFLLLIMQESRWRWKWDAKVILHFIIRVTIICCYNLLFLKLTVKLYSSIIRTILRVYIPRWNEVNMWAVLPYMWINPIRIDLPVPGLEAPAYEPRAIEPRRLSFSLSQA